MMIGKQLQSAFSCSLELRRKLIHFKLVCFFLTGERKGKLVTSNGICLKPGLVCMSEFVFKGTVVLF